MDNYICINNQRIDLTKEQVEKILTARDTSSGKLRDVPVGKTTKIGCHEMIVLDHIDGTTLLLRKDLLRESRFGKNNNYDGSNADAICNDFAKEIAEIVGEDNILLHNVDLMADDGLKNYGMIQRKASLLTTQQYRTYVEILDQFKPDDWWWLATPHSTATHGSDEWVKCVSPSGRINGDRYYYGCGVRPFCILKSNIFVSK